MRRLEEHGIRRYPFGSNGVLDLTCAARRSVAEEPRVEASSTAPLDLVIRWDEGEKTVRVTGPER